MNVKLFVCLFLISCDSMESGREEELKIVIKHNNSYIIDLDKRVYTIFYFGRPKVDTNFDLTDEENNQIKENYYLLKLNRPSGRIDIDDKCNIDPKRYTYISIKSKTFDQQIQIDASCEEFHFFDADKAERIKKFIQFIKDVVEAKPEIKKLPKSDIPSM